MRWHRDDVSLAHLLAVRERASRDGHVVGVGLLPPGPAYRRQGPL